MATGTVSTVKIDRGFGFIARAGGESDIFFHCQALCDGLVFCEQLVERRVEFEIAIDGTKRPRAVNVRAAD